MERLFGTKRAAAVLLKSLVAAALVTAALLLALAFLLLKLQLGVQKTEIGILAVYVLSCLCGGWYCGRKMGRRKFLWGTAVGVLYFLLLLLVSGMSEQSFQSGLAQSAAAFVLCSGGGMLGGMVS